MTFIQTNKVDTSKGFSRIQIGLASPESILQKSYGEILKPETINYRSYKPEKDGLFCEKIFGPVKDYECHCGKYKGIRYRGIICDRCGVEVTRKKVRRDRMGHITLAVPVVHIWYLRSIPSKLSYLTGISTKNLEKFVYFEQFLIIDPRVNSNVTPMMGIIVSIVSIIYLFIIIFFFFFFLISLFFF